MNNFNANKFNNLEEMNKFLKTHAIKTDSRRFKNPE